MKKHVKKPSLEELESKLNLIGSIDTANFYNVCPTTLKRWRYSYKLGVGKRAPNNKRFSKLCFICAASYLTGRTNSRYCSPKCRLGGIDKKRTNKASYLIKTVYADYKKQVGCALCGYKKCAGALVFHHITPEEKTKGITSYDFCYKTDHWFIESKKCVLICHNCHSEVHELLKIDKNKYLGIFDKFFKDNNNAISEIEFPGSD